MYVVPRSVPLTPDEVVLREKLQSDIDWDSRGEAMSRLFKSLRRRNAIPSIRLELFTNSDLAESGQRSPMEIFESNGTRGEEILCHPHFEKHLDYFIDGPELPEETKEEFCRILNDDRGTSGMLLDQLRSCARRHVRKYKLDNHAAARAFYRLAVELNIEFDPKSIRRAALSVRS